MRKVLLATLTIQLLYVHEMKRFMGGGNESNASRGQGGGCSSVISPLPTPHVDEDLATKASPTTATNAAATPAAPSLVAKQEVAKEAAAKTPAAPSLVAKQEGVKEAATKKVAAATHATAKVAAATHATAKVAAAKQAATKQTTAKEAAAKHAAATREEPTRLEALAAKQVGASQEDSAAATQEESSGANVARKELIPDVFSFSKPVGAATVADSFKAHYNFPYMNWTEVTETVRDRWFLQFKAVEKNGVPLVVDVFEKTHGLEMADGEKMLIEDRSKKTMAEYKEKLAEQ